MADRALPLRERYIAVSTTFESMGLNKALLQALASTGYTKPTPIQEKAIPDVMAGKDLLGIAQTCLLYTSDAADDM
jgi:ATP-dependent RNA helicase RhlE